MYLMTLICLIILMLTIILILMNLLISKKKNTDREKFSPFECGFDPISSARLPFSIQFYLISIIFLIFDIEIIIILPFITNFYYSSLNLSILNMMYFMMILMLGLYMEWMDGALKWLK